MFRILSGLLILSLGAGVACSVRAAPPTEDLPRGPAKLTGVLVFRDKLEFLPRTMIEITIREEGRVSTPVTPVGKQVLRDVKMAPVPFAVEYNPADVKKGDRYFLHARVFTTRGTQYTSTPDVRVFTAETLGKEVQVPMAPARERIGPDR
jgi:uncharacterized lipoprotein YbaY